MWKEHLSFNKRQRRGIIVLASLIVLLICLLVILDYMPPRAGNVNLSDFGHELKVTNYSHTSHQASEDSAAPPFEEGDRKYTSGKMININTCTVKELSQLTGYYLALALVNYREMHGRYINADDIRKCKAVDDSAFSRLKGSISTD
ncbi:MAG: hypothetical protein HKL88_05170 [Bacteroidia bacterium]|nr:hypothetical protein [Bacteroidia bacterium]